MGRCRSATLVGVLLLALGLAATLLMDVAVDDPVAAGRRRRPDDGAGEGEGLLDLPRFRYLLEPAPCHADNDTAVDVLLLITSHAGHVEARSAARRAHPPLALAALRVRRVFLLAAPRSADPGYLPPGALQDEARRFGDLVQGDFDEAYRNLSYKHVMGLRWAAERCPAARRVVKMDDDAVVDLHRLLELLGGGADSTTQPPPPLLGYVLAGRPAERDPRSKWCVTRDEYPADRYPPFLSGWLYATTPGVAARLARAARRLRYFWVDDVFVTGMAAREAGVPLRDVGRVFASHVELLQCCLASDRYQCDFIVGPNGGQTELIVKFEQHAARCRKLRCPQRPAHKSLRKTCVVKRTVMPPAGGHALVKSVQLR